MIDAVILDAASEAVLPVKRAVAAMRQSGRANLDARRIEAAMRAICESTGITETV